jgi:hypothetical protein
MNYKLVAVEQVSQPEGAARGGWHRYVIKNKTSTITGCRLGSKQDVMQHAVEFVEQLNSRIGNVSRSAWTSRQKTQ